MTRTLLIFSLIGVISGCALVDFSGLDAKSEFSCKAPQGVSCKSVSGIYANSILGNLPAQKVHEDESLAKDPQKKGGQATSGNSVYDQYEKSESLVSKMKAPHSGMAYRTQDVVLRIWIAPWEDAEDRLHDQHYIYTAVKSGSWLIEANRKRIKDEYKSVKPIKKNVGEPVEKEDDDKEKIGTSRTTSPSAASNAAQMNAQRFVMDAAAKAQQAQGQAQGNDGVQQ